MPEQSTDGRGNSPGRLPIRFKCTRHRPIALQRMIQTALELVHSISIFVKDARRSLWRLGNALTRHRRTASAASHSRNASLQYHRLRQYHAP